MIGLTDKEVDLLERCILLPIVRIVLEKDLQGIQLSQLKMKNVYIELLESALFQLSLEFKEVKRIAFSRRIKIVKGDNDGAFTEYKYFSKGFEGNVAYLNKNLKQKTETCIKEYFSIAKNK